MSGSKRDRVVLEGMLILDSNSSIPLVAQIVDGIKKLIVERRLRGGMKIPSIRQFAVANKVSVSTVVEAYDRLVAEGFLVARHNAGFYVRSKSPEPIAAGSLQMPGVSFDSLWLVKNIWENRSVDLKPGCGWLPESWLDEDGVRRNLRNLSNKSGRHLVGYGHSKGFPSLRWKISDWLNEHQICAPPEQTLLTTGASHALALIAHYLVRPGDDVLVDEPGYGVLLFTLRSYGANLVGVPWTPEGPDAHVLEALISQRRPKAFFTNPRLQNPTGVTYSPAAAHRVLQLAERHNFLIVEDDIYAGLDPSPFRPLASMDQLNRVIYVSSFSKTISPSLRVGFVAAHPDFIEDLTSLKMMSGLTTSEITERLAHEILTEGRAS